MGLYQGGNMAVSMREGSRGGEREGVIMSNLDAKWRNLPYLTVVI